MGTLPYAISLSKECKEFNTKKESWGKIVQNRANDEVWNNFLKQSRMQKRKSRISVIIY